MTGDCLAELTANIALDNSNTVGVINMIIDNLVQKNGESKCSAFRSCRDFHANQKTTKKVFVDPSGSASGINAYKVECNQRSENCTELITPEVKLSYHSFVPIFDGFSINRITRQYTMYRGNTCFYCSPTTSSKLIFSAPTYHSQTQNSSQDKSRSQA